MTNSRFSIWLFIRQRCYAPLKLIEDILISRGLKGSDCCDLVCNELFVNSKMYAAVFINLVLNVLFGKNIGDRLNPMLVTLLQSAVTKYSGDNRYKVQDILDFPL